MPTYTCPIHGEMTDDDPCLEGVWSRVGCIICCLEKFGAFGKDIEPRLAGGIMPAKPSVRLAAAVRCHIDDIERLCGKCGCAVFLRPTGPMDIPLMCLPCGVKAGILKM
jgi:hypothetical protein